MSVWGLRQQHGGGRDPLVTYKENIMYLDKKTMILAALRANLGYIVAFGLLASAAAIADDDVDGYVNSSGSYTNSYTRTDRDDSSYNNYGSKSSDSYSTPTNNEMMNEESKNGSGYSSGYKSIIEY